MASKLDQIRIPATCPSDWEEMAGDDRRRYCQECKKHVYNFSKMTRREAEALIATRQGNLCARIIRLSDGVILTDEIAASSHSTGRRALPVATAVFTAILTIGSSAVAQQPAFIGKPVPAVAKKAGDKKPQSAPQTGSGIVSIAGTVFDQSAAVIVGATVRLTNKQTGEDHIMKTSDEGTYRFTRMEAGSYTIRFEASGFSSAQFETVTVEQGEERTLDITLQVAAMGEIVSVPKLPLRALYSQSELIVVARVGNSVNVATEGAARLVKTQLEVSSTLKGAKHEPAINLYQWVYTGEKEIYSSGDTLLVFLKDHDEDGVEKASDGYAAVDTISGIKKLSEADLQVYIKRIEELAAILNRVNHDNAEIVEWLVRCAEHPATRWEGFFELASGGRILTAEQKERLSQSLFSLSTVTEKDVELIALVKQWDDGRLVTFLLEQLRRVEANNWQQAGETISLISLMFEDVEITSFAMELAKSITSEDDSEEAGRKRSERLWKFIALVESKLKK